MGHPMARNLLDAGFPMQVFNRTSSRTESLVAAGATACSTPAAAASGARIVIIMVSDTPDVESVLFGEDGAAVGAAKGTTVIDMSSISSRATVRFAKRLGEMGIEMLDAPVSGGDVGAVNGTLTIMAGGDADVFERVLPIFEVLGSRSTLIGSHGAGQVAKSCNQILVTASLMGVCEAITFARAAGLDLHRMIDAVSGGAAQSWQLENLGRSIANDKLEPGFMIDLLVKDLNIVCKTAQKLGLPHPASEAARNLFLDLQKENKGRLGTQALILAFENEVE